jgi:hypothetical protein
MEGTMGYDGQETDAAMLREYALDDAKETLLGEQVAYWHCGPYDQPGFTDKARQSDLRNWLDCDPSDLEWDIYKQAFEDAMKAGIAVCDAVEFDDDWDEEMETLEKACEAAAKAVERLNL